MKTEKRIRLHYIRQKNIIQVSWIKKSVTYRPIQNFLPAPNTL